MSASPTWVNLTSVMECDYCHQPAGADCIVRRTGKPAAITHAARFIWLDPRNPTRATPPPRTPPRR